MKKKEVEKIVNETVIGFIKELITLSVEKNKDYITLKELAEIKTTIENETTKRN
jgi:hypothetical protein